MLPAASGYGGVLVVDEEVAGDLLAAAGLPEVEASTVDELSLVLAVAAAAEDEAAGRLTEARQVLLDALCPGWRDRAVRAWLGCS